MATNRKIASLEFARIIAMVAIVGLHCQMALTYWQWDGVPWLVIFLISSLVLRFHFFPYFWLPYPT